MRRGNGKIMMYLSAFVVFFVITLIPGRRGQIEKAPPRFLANDTLNCNALFINTIGAKGYTLGYYYELFSYFDRDQLSRTVITPKEENMQIWSDFALGEPDFMIINSYRDTIPEMYQDALISSIPITSAEDVCVVRKEDYFFIRIFNNWFTYFKHTDEYKTLYNKYHKNYRYAKGISPYDAYIKESAMRLGWDWRLLASLIYQESKFKAGVSSSRGAIGLMQIKEPVAKKYGIENIYNPAENIKAGTMHLLSLQRMYLKMGADSLNARLIAMAAYNCGEGRIADIMTLTDTLDKPYLLWDTLASVIPLMADKKYYTTDGIKLGRFNGTETLRYMDNILERYEEYTEAL